MDTFEEPLQDDDDTVSSSDGSFMPPVLSDYANQLLFEDKDRQSRMQMMGQRLGGVNGSNINTPGGFHSTNPLAYPQHEYDDKMAISPKVSNTKRRTSVSPNSISSGGSGSGPGSSGSFSTNTSPPTSDRIQNTSTTPGIRPAATSFTRAPAADMTALRTGTMRAKRFGSNAFNKRLGKPLNFKGLSMMNGQSSSTNTALVSMSQLSVSGGVSSSSIPSSTSRSALTSSTPLESIPSTSSTLSTTSTASIVSSSSSTVTTATSTTSTTIPPTSKSNDPLTPIDDKLSPNTRKNRIRFAEEHEEIPHSDLYDSPRSHRSNNELRPSKSADGSGNYWHSDGIGSAANSSINSLSSSDRKERDWLKSTTTTPVADTSRHSNNSSKSDRYMQDEQQYEEQYDIHQQQYQQHQSQSQQQQQQELPSQYQHQRPQQQLHQQQHHQQHQQQLSHPSQPQYSRVYEIDRSALKSLSPNVPPQSSRFSKPPPKLENWGSIQAIGSTQEPERPAPPVPTDRADRADRAAKIEKLERERIVDLQAERDRSIRSADRKAKKNMMAINSKLYQRLELLGRGGSSKVYKVQSNEGKVFAVKKVTFDDVDQSVISGFKGEIDLLQRLRNEDRVVKLVDYEMHETSVYLVMECGEIDLAHVLSARLNSQLDISFVRYYSTEMLKCVQAVHNHGIVHSDLKPANFLLVKGMLKIIDFGIANVVPDYTANIHRDTQIGTPNYMAPEALLDANQFGTNGATAAKFKVGKPSDVWSCGCIIYQMVYGKPPYAAYSGAQRMLAIMNPKVQIQYPKHGLGGVKVPKEAMETIRGCLHREPSLRLTIDEVIDGSFLNPQAVDKNFIKSLLEHAVQYGTDRKEPISLREVELLADDVWKKIQLSNR